MAANNTSTTTIKVNYDGKEAERGLKSLRAAITTAFSTVAVKQIYDFTSMLAKTGAQAEIVRKNFENFASVSGKSTASMMADLRKATSGMVSDIELQQNAMKAMISGVSFDDMITAMEYVSKYAIATGADVTQKMTTTILGMARGSAKFLDDVGIMVMDSKDVVKDAVAQMKQKMDQFNISSEDASSKIANIDAEIENLKASIGKDLIPVLIAWKEGFLDVANAGAKIFKFLAMPLKLDAYITAYGSKSKAVFEVQLDNAKAIEDKYLKRATLELLQQRNEQRSFELAVKMEKMRKQSGDVVKTEKEYLEMQRELNEVGQNNLEIQNEIMETKKESAKVSLKGDPVFDKDAEKERKRKFLERLKWEIWELQKAEDEKAKIRAGLKLSPQFKEETQNSTELMLENMRTARERLGQLEEESIQDESERIDRRAQKEKGYWLTRLGRTEEYLKLEKAIEENAALEKSKIQDGDYKAELNLANEFNNVMQTFSDNRFRKELDNLDRKKLGEKRYNKERERILKEQEEQERKFARVQQAIILGQTIIDIAKGKGTALKKGFFGIPELIFVGAQGLMQIATIQAQHFQRGYLGEVDRARRGDSMNAMIGTNEAVVPAPQYAMHQDDIKAIVNNTANTAAGMRALRGGSIVNQFYGLSSEQVTAVMRDMERRKYTGRLI